MSERFDPYYTWLSIPPDEQPPDHYRLLGVRPFESNADVISHAADRQMSHVRTFQTGPRSAESQRLLNEIAAARVCLLNDKSRAAYDEKLRAKRPPALPKSLPTAKRIVPASSLSSAPQGVAPGAAPASAHPAAAEPPTIVAEPRAATEFSSKGSATPLWIAAVVAIVALAGGGYWLATRPDDSVASQDGTEETGAPGDGPAADATKTPPPSDGPQGDPENPPRPSPDKSPPEKTGSGELLPRPAPRPRPVVPPDMPPGKTEPARTPTEPIPLAPAPTDMRPVDLLKAIDPAQHSLRGAWRMDNGALAPPRAEAQAVLQAPIAAPEDYDLELVATHDDKLRPTPTLVLGVVVGGRQVAVVVDAFNGGLSGVEMIDGRPLQVSPAQYSGRVFRDGQPHTVLIQARRDGLAVLFDGQPAMSWTGDPRRLSPSPQWRMPGLDRQALFLGAMAAEYRITKFELRPVAPGTALAAAAPSNPRNPARPPRPGESPRPENPVRPQPPQIVKSPPPDAQAIKDSLKLIKDLYKKEYAAAIKPPEKLALANKLLAQAEQTRDNAAHRYVLYQQAIDLASGAGNTSTTLRGISRLWENYTLSLEESGKLTVDSLATVERVATANGERISLVNSILVLAGEATAKDRFNDAKLVLAIARRAAIKTKQNDLVDRVAERGRELDRLEKAHQGVEAAVEKLASTPDDPAANLTVGRYRCFAQGRWNEGLPLLAKCSDAAVKSIAERELLNPTVAAEQAALAADWWTLSTKGDFLLHRAALRERACVWYDRALPGLKGPERIAAERRIEEVSGAAIVKRPDGSVDLLPLALKQVGSKVGEWRIEGNSVVSPDAAEARWQLPYTLPAEYELTFTAERVFSNRGPQDIEGRDAFVVGLASGESQFLLAVDWFARGRSHFTGLLTVDGRQPGDGHPAGRFATHFNFGRPTTITCRVLKSGVTVTSGSTQLITWAGDAKRLTLPDGWSVPDRKRLFIGSHHASYRITRLDLKPLGK